MDKKTKILIFSKLLFFLIFIIIWTVLHYAFMDLSSGYKGMISAGLAFILAPRITYFKAQSGKQIQLKWIFLKKSISA